MRLQPALLLSLGLVLSLPALAVPKIEIDGQPLGGPACVVQSGNTLVPLRSIFERLGVKVKFAPATSTITAEKTNPDQSLTTIVLKLGSRDALVKNAPIRLMVPAQAIDGTTYVPLRFVAEALGTKVTYLAAEQKIVISTGQQPVASNPALPPIDPFDATVDLKRLSVGNQGGILKVWDRSKKQVVLFRGIDDRGIAALSEPARAEIFASVGVAPARVSAAADEIMGLYPSVPKKEAIALLGALGSSPSLSASHRSRLQSFVCSQLSDADVTIRRQALLSLAIMGQPTASTTDRVLRVFETSENLWETFPVQQFFEYNASAIANPEQVRLRVSKVASLYTSYLLGYLDAAGSKPVVPNIGS